MTKFEKYAVVTFAILIVFIITVTYFFAKSSVTNTQNNNSISNTSNAANNTNNIDSKYTSDDLIESSENDIKALREILDSKGDYLSLIKGIYDPNKDINFRIDVDPSIDTLKLFKHNNTSYSNGENESYISYEDMISTYKFLFNEDLLIEDIQNITAEGGWNTSITLEKGDDCFTNYESCYFVWPNKQNVDNNEYYLVITDGNNTQINANLFVQNNDNKEINKLGIVSIVLLENNIDNIIITKAN